MAALKFFASDNNSGAHPRVLDAIARANTGAACAYGEDRYTQEAALMLQEAFGSPVPPWFVLLGTAANVLGLKAITRSHEAVLCTRTAHIECDECGAPEALVGCKLIALPSYDGKIRLQDIVPTFAMREGPHHSYPRVLSITQSTECGTVYTLDELRSIKAFCVEHDLYLHMDGARLANAAASLGVSFKELTADIGVDVLSFGGTKNGLLFGEAVFFFDEALAASFEYIRKQHMQLLSKMRFLSVQFSEYLKDGLWLENAAHANRMAALLAENITGLDHVRFMHPVEVNALFVRLPKKAIAKLHERFYFYVMDESDVEGVPAGWPLVRLMTSFDTTEEQVLEFADAIRACVD